MKLYTIYDKKAAEYMPAVCQPNNITALRAIQNALRSKTEVLNLRDYPHDFALYATGEFDETKGLTTGYPVPEFIEEISNLLPEINPHGKAV